MSMYTRRFAFCALCASGVGLGLAGQALAQAISNPTQLGVRAKKKDETVTVKDEAEVGAKLYAKSIDQMGGAYPNRALQSAVQRVAEPILRTTTRSNFAWEVTVIDSSEVNAWCLPGGKMGVNKGLLRYVENEDELAAVIAHEMGHAEFSHMVKEGKDKQMAAMGLAVLSGLATAGSSRNSRVSVGAGAFVVDISILGLAVSGYSRDNEREADRHIATVFAKTGHSVARGAGFYRTLLELIPQNERGATSLFSGHPDTRERLAILAALQQGTPPPPRSSPDFAAVKAVFPTRKAYLRG